MGNPSPSQAFRGVSAAEWVARRNESIKQIAVLLAERRLTVADVAERLHLARATAYSHLAHMEGLGLAHRTREKVGNNTIWAAGEKPDEEEPEEVAPVRVRTEVVVQRDPLVAALFGPARAQLMMNQQGQ